MADSNNQHWLLIVLATLVASSIFFLDVMMTLEVATDVLYAFVILIIYRRVDVKIILFFGALCSTLVLIGLYFSYTSTGLVQVVENHLLALGAIWITVWISFESEQSNQKVIESEQRFRAIIINATDSMIAINDVGHIYIFNPAAEKLFGYSQSEVIGQNIKMLMPEPYHSEHDQYINNYHRTSEKKIIGIGREVIAQRKDGSTFPIDLAISEAISNHGKIYFGTLRDITEKKLIEKELRENEERIRTVVETVIDGIITITDKGIIQSFNPAAAQLFGYTQEEIIGRNINTLMPEPYHSEHDGYLHSYIKTGNAKIIGIGREVSGLRKDKTTFPMDLSVSEMRLSDQRMFTGIVRDISERKENERNLITAKQAAETATEAKANFLAAMSHEIRTPMNGIIGMVDILRQTELKDDQMQMLQTINDSGQTLLSVINSILDFSKIEAGKLDLEFIPLSLTDVVEGSSQIIAHTAIKKGLRLITYVDPELPQFVTGDPFRVRQIITNLGSNAIKFTEEGDVVVQAERVGDGEDDKVTVRFSVIDQGIGISEENQAKLFKAFSQAESSTTRKFGGTGLGLTICKRLTDGMGGEIGVKSLSGEGSEFYVTLSFSRSDKQILEDKVCSLEGIRILLINSNPTEESVLRRYLEYWHAEVTSSDELSTCLEQCMAAKGEDKPYDTVVIGPQWAREEQFEMRERVMTQSTLCETRFICLLKGTRGSTRLDLPNSVCLDVDPLRRVIFLTAIAVTVGRASPEAYHEEEVENMTATVKTLTVDEALAQGTLILVAEDNFTNRDVISRQLSLLGYTYEIVEDGRQALEAWRNKNYAILLTDCHMPNMDGFELTDAIRKDEKGTETHIPIIATTANALQGEADRCLAAGMNDYLSKPTKMQDIRQILRKWMPQVKTETTWREGPEEDTSTAEKTIAVNEETRDSPIDERALKDEFGDDLETFKEILIEFVEPAREDLQEIERALQDRSAEGVRLASHKLKSACKIIGANALSDLCNTLEQAGKEIDWDTIDEQSPHLNELMDDVAHYINSL